MADPLIALGSGLLVRRQFAGLGFLQQSVHPLLIGGAETPLQDHLGDVARVSTLTAASGYWPPPRGGEFRVQMQTSFMRPAPFSPELADRLLGGAVISQVLLRKKDGKGNGAGPLKEEAKPVGSMPAARVKPRKKKK